MGCYECSPSSRPLLQLLQLRGFILEGHTRPLLQRLKASFKASYVTAAVLCETSAEQGLRPFLRQLQYKLLCFCYSCLPHLLRSCCVFSFKRSQMFFLAAISCGWNAWQSSSTVARRHSSVHSHALISRYALAPKASNQSNPSTSVIGFTT